MDFRKIEIRQYAKELSEILALAFWASCILIGRQIAINDLEFANFLICWIGFLMPVFAWYLVCLIRERHNPSSKAPKRLYVPFLWGIAYLFVYVIVVGYSEKNHKLENLAPEQKALYKKYEIEP